MSSRFGRPRLPWLDAKSLAASCRRSTSRDILCGLVISRAPGSRLLIINADPTATIVPRLEIDAEQATITLVLANGDHSQEQPLGLLEDGVWLRLDPYDRPLRILCEDVRFENDGSIDLRIRWTAAGASEEEMPD